jgi:O-6-methylguanine DNA methyltransferase
MRQSLIENRKLALSEVEGSRTRPEPKPALSLSKGRRVEDQLIALRHREHIPTSTRRAAIRARLLERYAEMNLAIFETRLGWFGVAFSARGLAGIQLPRATRAQTLAGLQRGYPAATVVDAPPPDIVRELREYAEGRRREFDLQLDWSAVKPFQRAVLRTADSIKYGETRSYGWIARAIGKPRAARAVGRALASNPLPIILPCHRVLGSDGGLHGYGGGLPLKRKLLELEGARL